MKLKDYTVKSFVCIGERKNKMLNAEQSRTIAEAATAQDLPIMLEKILNSVKEAAEYGNGKYSTSIIGGFDKTYMWSNLYSMTKTHIREKLEALGYSVHPFSDSLQISW